MPDSKIQSVLFDKQKFTPAKARAWLKKHKLISKKIDTTADYHRFRQFNPSYKNGIKYRTVSIAPGIKYIIML